MRDVAIRTRRNGDRIVVSYWRPAVQVMAIAIDPADLPAHPLDRQQWMIRRIYEQDRRDAGSRPEECLTPEDFPTVTRLAEAMLAKLGTTMEGTE